MRKSKPGFKNVFLTEETHKRLKDSKIYRLETFNDIISRHLDELEKLKKKHS